MVFLIFRKFASFWTSSLVPLTINTSSPLEFMVLPYIGLPPIDNLLTNNTLAFPSGNCMSLNSGLSLKY